MTSDATDTDLPFAFAQRYGVLLESVEGGRAVILAREDSAEATWREVRRSLQRPISLKRCSEEEFARELERHYGGGQAGGRETDIGMDLDFAEDLSALPKSKDLLDTEDGAPIIRLINALLRQALNAGASDVHIEPYDDFMRARLRVDGGLQTIFQTRLHVASMVASRVKIMADLDIAEKRLPQDGRIALRIGGRLVDVRVSTLPGPHGERVVLRILDRRSGRLTLDQVGVQPDQLSAIKTMLGSPNGIILVTGPTGSGKTTTLYAMIERLNDGERNILTVEDPIEYELAGIGQTQVNPQIGMTFARCLRAILRQDPDVILVGEIRDAETAQIAVQASLTGHLVLATLHTNSAVGAVTRLRDMDVESYLLSSTVCGLMAQRLVRTLCLACEDTSSIAESDRGYFHEAGLKPPDRLPVARGCLQCGHLGYRGRSGIYEVVPVDDEIRGMIHADRSEAEMEDHAFQIADNLRRSALKRVVDGTTSLEEALRVTRE